MSHHDSRKTRDRDKAAQNYEKKSPKQFIHAIRCKLGHAISTSGDELLRRVKLIRAEMVLYQEGGDFENEEAIENHEARRSRLVEKAADKRVEQIETGGCMSPTCDKHQDDATRFCNSECMSDYQAYQRVQLGAAKVKGAYRERT